ncbi:hypothetical protein [Vibrio sp. 10N]|uniref:hypothetical protein n=1 Tax=Vibrio sp. 10N TaxID=3058938 RepID=UPI002814450F|nr:hypothetical protein VB10N_33040 [Vibrio sp. 10N]
MSKAKFIAVVVVLIGLMSAPSFAHPHGHHKHKHKHKHKNHHHKEVIVVKKYHPSPKKRPKHRHYHYKKMPRHTTYIKIGSFTYARVDGHYYQRKGDTYFNVIIK